MKIIIAGSRDFCDYKFLCEKMDYLLSDRVLAGEEIVIISGMAKGADNLGCKYAQSRGYKILEYPAKWDKYGKSAGMRRNVEMANVADAVVTFWDGKSVGTANMIKIARERGIKLRIVRY